ncbi:MAG: cytochrome c biogenesis CcdA family protein, partial [Acidimicrobiia bacterium]
MDLALPLLAVVAGFVSISSPCVLPLIPGYISYITALPVPELGTAQAKRTGLRASLLFVAGFTVVFTALGAGFALVGSLLLRNADTITRIAGLGIIAMGAAMIGWLKLPGFQRERRIDLGRIARGPGSAFPLGMAFGFGWTPCIGPILGTILAIAGATQTAGWGAALLMLYSLGLGIPFVLAAVWFQKSRSTLEWLRRNGRHIELAGGSMLIVVGVLFTTGIWQS